MWPLMRYEVMNGQLEAICQSVYAIKVSKQFRLGMKLYLPEKPVRLCVFFVFFKSCTLAYLTVPFSRFTCFLKSYTLCAHRGTLLNKMCLSVLQECFETMFGFAVDLCRFMSYAAKNSNPFEYIFDPCWLGKRNSVILEEGGGKKNFVLIP